MVNFVCAVRKVLAYKNHFIDFYKAQNNKVQLKRLQGKRLKKRKGLKKNISQKKKNNMKNVTDFEDLLKSKYGHKGSEQRDQYDSESLAFRLGVMLKEARQQANLTQEQLAERTGTKKSYISRIERGLSDIQFSTYNKLIEIGLGKHLNISIG